ncbi:MAG: orotate phosphoribosyltransferase [Cytophagaceae bacterium]|nr:orotate phosphoribosyltransferase [Cytophagaceae bacterium]|tara:strand:- start:5677 stop:6069 length:393 start_codon:yes stop_codon:yes gene_type:complete
MKLQSPEKVINKTPEEVYAFLNTVENYEQLMPDNISKFEVLGEKRFLFALKGMPEIVLDLKESIPYNKVILGAASDKLPFTLTSEIKEVADDSSEVQLFFEGQFNTMISMMVKSPLQKFMDTLVTNMQKI